MFEEEKTFAHRLLFNRNVDLYMNMTGKKTYSTSHLANDADLESQLT